jgi:DNA polymerase sigma
MKHFLAQRGHNETYQGGLGSFLLQLMVISSVQVIFP